MRTFLVILFLFFCALAFGLHLLSSAVESVKELLPDSGATLSLPDSDESDYTFAHRWKNETLRWTKWDGDSPVADRNIPASSMDVETSLSASKHIDIASRFGVPADLFDDSAPARPLRPQLRRDGPRRGFKFHEFEDERIEIEPDYDWIVTESRGDLLDLAGQLQEIAYGLGATDRNLVQVASSLCQTLEYKLPKRTRTTADGSEVATLGIALPHDVLYNKWGDCDSKSLLFASLLSYSPRLPVIFLRGNDHLFAGVRMIPRDGDHYAKVRGVEYVLIEMTNPWPVGRIPLANWSAQGRNEFEVVRLLNRPWER